MDTNTASATSKIVEEEEALTAPNGKIQQSEGPQQILLHQPIRSSKPNVVSLDGVEYHIPPHALTEEVVADLGSMESEDFVKEYELRWWDE